MEAAGFPCWTCPPELQPLSDGEATITYGAAWVFVEPRFVTDILIVLASCQATFLSLYEKNVDRRRWLTNIDLQTSDPSAED